MPRKKLSADGMVATLRETFERVNDFRGPKAKITTADALLTAMSAFSFKFDSFKSFYGRLEFPDGVLKGVIGGLYKIENVPSPTRIKEIIDPIPTKSIMPGFKDIFREVQRGKALEPYIFWNGHYLVAGDGSQYFESKKINCKRCLTKKLKNGETSYTHQMYAGVIVHPALKPVLPITAPEPIQNSDGATKNDSERNASARYLERLREEHPKMKFIITEDGLSSNAPHIRKIQSLGMKFILSAKPGDHKYLFNHVNSLGYEIRTAKRICNFTGKRVLRRTVQKIRYINGVPLNESNSDLKVNFLELEETIEKRVEKISHYSNGKPIGTCEWVEEKTTTFSWVTDIPLNDSNVFTIMEGGRKRWSIENETFNGLKNMGYNWEHNYGHGEDNLSTNFALLMMLAFAIDQIQELCCPLFRKVLKRVYNCKKFLWAKIKEKGLGVPSVTGKFLDSWQGIFNLIYGIDSIDSS